MSEAVLEQQPLTEIERVVDVFVAPSKTFTDILRKKSWWLPFLIIVITSYLFGFAVTQKVGLDQLASKAIEQRVEKTGQPIPPEQMEKSVTFTKAIFKGTFIAYPVIYILSMLVLALLLWLGFNFILGGSSTFGQMLSVSIYASLVGIIRSVIAVATIWFGNNDNFDLQNPAGTNPGYFLSADASKGLIAFMTSLDVTTLWMLALCALGAAIVAKVKVRSGMVLVFAAWFIFVLLKTVIAAV